jgi:molybdate transport system substrate-binding protein
MTLRPILAMATKLGVAMMLAHSLAAGAADIRVFCTNGIKAAILELVPEFERTSGHKVSFDFKAAALLADQLKRGDSADLAILTASLVDAMAKEGKLVSGSRVDLVQAGAGVAVRAGAPKPDISTVEAFKRTLLQAKSIAYASSGASGTYFVGLTERMGIAAQVKAKAKTLPGGEVAEQVARGEAELVVLQIPELMAVHGVELVGPLPKEVQLITVFSAGIASNARQPEAAKALVQFLTAPAAARVFKSKGLEPS